MERLPPELWLGILGLLDHRSLATAQLVCRKLRSMGSDDTLWYNLFLERWGEDCATVFSPAAESKCWKDVYVTQDRGDRIGLGLKIIREGDDYYLVHLGEIQRHLGTRTPSPLHGAILADKNPSGGEEPCSGILDKILFFIGDLDSALNNVKRSRAL